MLEDTAASVLITSPGLSTGSFIAGLAGMGDLGIRGGIGGARIDLPEALSSTGGIIKPQLELDECLARPVPAAGTGGVSFPLSEDKNLLLLKSSTREFTVMFGGRPSTRPLPRALSLLQRGQTRELAFLRLILSRF